MKVTVKSGIQEQFIGFFNHIRRRPGDVFTIPDQPRRILFAGEQRLVETDAEVKDVYNSIKDRDGKVPSAFSFRWMEPAARGSAERITTSQQALDSRSEIIKLEKAGEREAVLGGGGDDSPGSDEVI